MSGIAPTFARCARFVESRRFTLGAAALALLLLAALDLLRGTPGVLIGDEPTFVAMAASLARDGDLRFEAADAAWAREQRGQPAGLILQRVPAAISYSKPILYPLLAAPWFALLGRAGLLLFHALALTAALAVAKAALVRRVGGTRALETLATFAFASIIVPHVSWWTPETLQVALALAGLAMTLGGELPGDGSSAAQHGWLARRTTRLAGAALLGLLVALREPNALVAAVPIVAALLARRWRRAFELALVMAALYALVIGVTVALAGAPNPYKALRTTFSGETGYPAGPDSAAALARFDVEENAATSSLGAVPRLQPVRSAYAALYFLVGRHSGLVVYFPLALILLWTAFSGGGRRERLAHPALLDRVGRAALFGFLATALFFLVWWPENYFGGETHLGNRYLLAAYPCLLFVPRRLPSRRALGVAWLIGFAFAVSALVSVLRVRAVDPTSQSHTRAGLFRLLPYESVATAIEGRRDRYWSRDFLRFVDPFAKADDTNFDLVAGAPAAEVEVATAWEGTPLRFLVVASSPEATVEISDWLETERFKLTPDGHGRSGGVIELTPSPGWRFHEFWWPTDRPYRVRFLRFRLEAPPASKVRFRYLGRERVPESGFGREVVSLVLPTTVRAGERGELEVVVTNRSDWPWSSNVNLPVLLGARFEPLDSSPPPRGARTALPGVVKPGKTVTIGLPIDWPTTPGSYRLIVDLVMEDVAWFADRVGAPLGETTVTVVK